MPIKKLDAADPGPDMILKIEEDGYIRDANGEAYGKTKADLVRLFIGDWREYEGVNAEAVDDIWELLSAGGAVSVNEVTWSNDQAAYWGRNG